MAAELQRRWLSVDNLIFDRSAPVAQNAADWNRLETWTAYLAAQLRSYGYSVTVQTRTWTRTDYPTRGEVDRIRRNVDALQAGFYSLPDWREIVYDNTLNFEQCNALEWDLQRLYDWLAAMVEAFRWRHANTFFMESGGVFNA